MPSSLNPFPASYSLLLSFLCIRKIFGDGGFQTADLWYLALAILPTMPQPKHYPFAFSDTLSRFVLTKLALLKTSEDAVGIRTYFPVSNEGLAD